ncbi:MAG: hypothetical protein JWO64_3010, partial [Hyphomicrobiales bacterium]|nr:hypothetical protein [Hyphomicrobiales bacterium]
MDRRKFLKNAGAAAAASGVSAPAVITSAMAQSRA